jgi:hypothetical protein
MHPSNDPMPLRVNPLFVICAGVAIFGATCPGQAATADPVVPEFWFPEPAPALIAAAQAADVALAGREYDPARAGLAQGDAVTLLIEHIEAGKRRQWIVVLVGSELSEKGRALAPLPDMRLYTAAGNELNFAGTRAALAIRVLGPVLVEDESRSLRERPPPSDVPARVLVNGDFLRLGFARAEAAMQRVREAQFARQGENAAEFILTARDTPLPEEVVARGRAAAAELGITKDDEQAIFGSSPALTEFFNVAGRTPGVNGIVKSVIDIPVWSILARGGRGPDVKIKNFGSARINPARRFGVDDSTEVYERAFLLELNRRPALCCRMAVVEPHPPLAASAGILAFAAGRPDGKGPRLMIRLIASKLAPEPPDDPAVGKN